MNSFIDMILKMKAQSDERVAELKAKTETVKRVVNEVYSEREAEIEKEQKLISSLLRNGDFETAMSKLAEVKTLMSQSPDKEIELRLSDDSLKTADKEI